MKTTSSYSRSDEACIDGTSYYNVCVYATLEKMVEKFGPPQRGEGYKTKHEWTFRGPTQSENIAVYDYKYDGSVSGEWHVGATSYANSVKFEKWFNEMMRG